MKRVTIIICMLVCLSPTATPQTFNRTDYYFGDSTNTLNTICSSVRIDNNLFLVVGIVDSLQDQRATLVKTDLQGNVIKTTIISKPLERTVVYYGETLIMDSDSFMLFCASTTNYSTAHTDGYLVKFDRNLDTLWTRAYDIPDSLSGCVSAMNYFSVIRQCLDGNYIVACNFNLNCATGNRRSALCKLDTAGNVLWWRTYPNQVSYNEIFDLEIAPDGGFYLPMYQNSTISYLVKTDSIGSIDWTVPITFPGIPSGMVRMALLDTNTFVISSTYWRDPAFKEKGLIVSSLNITSHQFNWWKSFYMHYSFQTSEVYQHHSLEITPDGGIVIAGTAACNTYPAPYGYKGVLLKLNHQGDSLWSRYYEIRIPEDKHQFNDLILMPDGGYLMVGAHGPYDGSYRWGAWMVRTDSLGWAPGSQTLGMEQSELHDKGPALGIFPNPASNRTTVEFGSVANGTLLVLDISGHILREYSVSATSYLSIDLTTLKSGNYLLRFVDETGRSRMGKVVVVD